MLFYSLHALYFYYSTLPLEINARERGWDREYNPLYIIFCVYIKNKMGI